MASKKKALTPEEEAKAAKIKEAKAKLASASSLAEVIKGDLCKAALAKLAKAEQLINDGTVAAFKDALHKQLDKLDDTNDAHRVSRNIIIGIENALITSDLKTIKNILTQAPQWIAGSIGHLQNVAASESGEIIPGKPISMPSNGIPLPPIMAQAAKEEDANAKKKPAKKAAVKKSTTAKKKAN